MIKWLQLKHILRNPRFLLFTIVIPGAWYVLMLNMIPSHTDINYVIFLIACLWGIGGNSVVTFGKRINSGRQYYALKDKTSFYSLGNYLVDQVFLQVLLNLLIIAFNLVIGFVSSRLTFDYKLIICVLLLSLAGLYTSVIGFTLGILLQAETLDALDFPLMLIMMMLVSPFNSFMSTNNDFLKLVINIQKFFPFHYIYNALNDLLTKQSLVNDLGLLCLTFVVTLIPWLIIIWWKDKKGELNAF
ncbi:lantibiotic ABC transporter permease [Lactobacillus sp. ESL0791]|uniref:lantibiotic ABC transporter permease n=1 Tax=Lactobacillus sp. ESL0791 TaxID=2983234 RepID=UPI0023F7AD9C|nr:lantibiotic ABC transporter permease [Lactobacillus sp. ESL0791]MDF7639518.1 lantibiotic ABC transporter permease [Lactobacillus sp. ESL0791]